MNPFFRSVTFASLAALFGCVSPDSDVSTRAEHGSLHAHEIMDSGVFEDASEDAVEDESARDLGSHPERADSGAEVDQEASSPTPESDINIALAMRRAHDAYVYGYAAVLMDVTREAFLANGVRENTLVHLREIPDERFRAVVRPNTDTLYSTAWLDLSKGPVVLTVPAIDPEERFYMFALLDAWTNAFAAPGTRHNNGEASVYAIVPRGHSLTLPEGMIPIEAPTDTVWLIGRVEVFGEDDVPAVTSLQDRFGLMTLEDYRAGTVRDEEPLDYSKLSIEPSPPEIVASMTPEAFYAQLARIMAKNPPPERDAKQLEQLEEVGVVPGDDFDLHALTPNRIEALETAPENARDFIDATLRIMSETRTWAPGHRVPLGEYETSYLIRAVVARIGLGANLNADARYINAKIDSRKRLLDGSSGYVIHFDASEVPPVRAFWSLTVYDQDGYLLPDVSRAAVGSNTGLHVNRDGSIDIWLQEHPPVLPSRLANWLPVKPGPFELTMRMYWPEEAILDGSWEPPSITRRSVVQ